MILLSSFCSLKLYSMRWKKFNSHLTTGQIGHVPALPQIELNTIESFLMWAWTMALITDFSLKHPWKTVAEFWNRGLCPALLYADYNIILWIFLISADLKKLCQDSSYSSHIYILNTRFLRKKIKSNFILKKGIFWPLLYNCDCSSTRLYSVLQTHCKKKVRVCCLKTFS